MGGSASRTARTADVQNRRAEALALRVSGRTFAEVASELGIARSRAHGLVQEALDAIPVEAAGEMRAVEGARLDRLLAAALPLADEGDLQAVDVCRKLSESRRKLFGLDAPTKNELSGPGGAPLGGTPAPPADIARLIVADLGAVEGFAALLASELVHAGHAPAFRLALDAAEREQVRALPEEGGQGS